ncbi:hypothetical protein MCEHALHM7_01186 [Methylophilaceae bacterium]
MPYAPFDLIKDIVIMISQFFQNIQVSFKSQNKLPATLASLITELIH